jgi:hypothetical protein
MGGRHWLIALCLVAVAGCSDSETPTGPSTSTVDPFVTGTPGEFIGARPPNLTGRWTGQYQRVACRATFSASCTRDPFPRPEPITLHVNQDGTKLSGMFEYALDATQPHSFVGYVTATQGIAGTVVLRVGGHVLVRFVADGSNMMGSFYTESRDAANRLVQTRKYDVVMPLSRGD